MRKPTPIATHTDRRAERAMLALAGLPVLFFLSFLFVLAQAVSANASSDACRGDNLLERYQREYPAKYERLRSEADAELNGKGTFWRIEGRDGTTSWLLGTMHMADARIAQLGGERLAAFDKAGTIIVENVEALDPARSQAAMLEYRDMTLFTDGSTLADRLEPDTLARLKAAVEARGIPFAVAQMMQPWLVATMVALPACELAEKQAGKPVLDALIVAKAQEAGKTLEGLETIGEQFSAISNLPEAFHLEALRETLAMGDLAEDVIETLKDLYLAGDTGMVFPLTQAVSPRTAGSEDYAGFKESLIDRRNVLMAERSLPYLEAGGAFIAVGALHLPGETGLIEAFRRAGYTVERADTN